MTKHKQIFSGRNLFGMAALAAVFSGMTLEAAAADGGIIRGSDWRPADTSYRVKNLYPGGLIVSEFTPLTAPDFTCIVVQAGVNEPATMSCVPRASVAPKNDGMR